MDMKVENITHGAISVVDVREKVERYEEIIHFSFRLSYVVPNGYCFRIFLTKRNNVLHKITLNIAKIKKNLNNILSQLNIQHD